MVEQAWPARCGNASIAALCVAKSNGAASGGGGSPPAILFEEFDGTCAGNAYGLTYAPALNGLGAVFWRTNESRIEYPLGTLMPTQGTLEWWIRVDRGYRYYAGVLQPDLADATVFTSEYQDVSWAGGTYFNLNGNGDIEFYLTTSKYGLTPAQVATAPGTAFRYGEWHAVGISFGSQGQYIMLDGQLVASNAANTQVLGTGGAHDIPCDVPTLGAMQSCFFPNNQYEGGFEGMVDRFRISSAQQDWFLAAAPAGASSTNPPTIFRPPQDQTTIAGDSVIFDVQAYGAWPLTYQWRFNGVDLPGQTNATLALMDVTTNQLGVYSVLVSNSYGTVLSSDASLRLESNIAPPPGLVAWWSGDGHFDDLAGTDDGVPMGGVSFAPGKVGQAFSLDGMNGFVEIANSPTVSLTNNFTIALWFFQKASIPSGFRLVDKETAGIGDGFDFDTCDGATGRRLRFISAGPVAGTGSSIFTLNTWHHAAVTLQDGVLRLYLDGVLDGLFTGMSAVPTNGLSLRLGAPHVGCGGSCGIAEYFNGLLDEVLIFNRALSSNEVADIYLAGSAGFSDQPYIFAQPPGQILPIGSNVTLNVGASGSEPLSYQWRFAGTNLPAATNATLNLTNVQPAQTGAYSVVVSNALGVATSSDAVLTVVPLAITTQPRSQTVLPGDNVTFSVSVDSLLPVGYQWRFNGADLPGATNATLTLAHVTLNQAGAYSVAVSNAYGAVTSSEATLGFKPWAWREPGVFVEDLYGVVWGGGQFVAVGYSGAILTSPDGENWSRQNAGTSEHLHGVNWANGWYIAVGMDGTILTSTNATNWAGCNSGVLAYLKSVAYGNGVYVAVGSAGTILVSTNGSSWIRTALGLTPLGLNCVTFGNGLFVVVGDHTHAVTYGGIVLSSTNGLDWSFGANPVYKNLRGVTAGPAELLAVGNDGTILRANNPASWSVASVSPSIPITNLRGVAWADGQYVVVGNDGTILTSPDTLSWDISESGVTENLHSVAYGLGSAVAVGNAGTIIQSRLRTDPPVLVTEPVSQTVAAGPTAFFSVGAVGTRPLSYQWRSSCGPLAEATNAVLALPSVTTNQSGCAYWAEVANAYGAVTSAWAVLTVTNIPGAPSITAQPQDQVASYLGNAVLQVAATGQGALSYQWYRGSSGATAQPMAGATEPTLVTPPVSAPVSFWVRVRNAAGFADSRAARVSPPVPRGWDLRGMGQNNYGQLGDGTTNNRSTPGMVASGVAQVAAGTSHSLFVKPDGTLWAMGDNSYGQLGDGTTTNRALPVRVTSGVAQAAAGSFHSLFVKTDGTLWAMGQNWAGQLGDGTTATRSNLVRVATNVVQVAAGGTHSLFVKTDGTLWAMGYNNPGQLGDGTTTSRSIPVLVTTNVAQVAAGGSHSLFVKTDGTLWAMGYNFYGQLGDRTTANRSTPVLVTTNVAQVAAGGSHSLFVKTDGTLLAMGANAAGQLGDGTMTSHTTPVRVANGVAQVAAGGDDSLFVTAVGTLWAMGYNSYGQLGDGTVTTRSIPVLVANAAARAAAGGSHSLFLEFPNGIMAPVIGAQPQSRTNFAGTVAVFTVGAFGTPPLACQWSKDGVVLWLQTNATLTLSNVQPADAGSYSVVVRNGVGSVASTAAVLTVGLPRPDSGFVLAANGSVTALALQPDGKILVGGLFTTLGGVTRNHLARLNPEGTLDTDFNPGASSTVSCLAVQPDGKILVGGIFTNLAGQSRDRLARLNADGTLDLTFDPGASSIVSCLALQADGRILVGGFFTTLGGQPRHRLARLNTDGTLDPEFNPDPNSTVSSLALQADGQILVSGVFTTLGGQPRAHLARLNADGTLDAGFNPAANSSVYSLAVQADGSILVGGAFTTLGGQARSRLARLNADGTLDPSFSPGADGSVYSLAVQADGKILAAGSFTTLGGEPRSYVGRLNADGTVDPAFPPALNNFVYALAVQADGKTVLGGAFTTLGGLPCNGLARFDPIEPATQSLTCDDSTVTWWRGGTSPEVWQTSFDYSADGLHWTSLGFGTRLSGLPAGQTGGWELAGLSLPPAGTLRARGYVTGGQFNGSAGFVETMLVRPVALRLRLVRDGSNVVLRWPSVMTGYVLESTASLSPSAGWSPVTNQVTIAGSDCITTHGMDSPARFYRLRSR